jgi:glycosyltransferase involved in cell wall biosynthesis
MNVLHVVYSFDVSGRSRCIHDLSRGLEGRGLSFAVASLTADPRYRAEGIECVPLGKREGFDPAAVVRLARLIRSKSARIVHTHGRGAVLYAAGAQCVAGRRRWIHTVHRSDGDAVSGNAWARKLMLRRLDLAVGVSDAAREAFARTNRFPASKIRTIYNGIDVGRFQVSGFGFQEAAGPRRAADPEAPVIGTVANLSRDKDAGTLLKGFAGLLAVKPAARLVMVGGGPEEPDIKRLVSHLGLDGRVELPGYCHDVPRLLRGFDVFVLASRTEGFGLAILEAMAAGVPVVASAVGGIPEIVEDGVTGRLFAAGDAAALSEALLALLADERVRRGLAARANALVREKFSVERMCEQYRRLYADLTASPRGTADRSEGL